MLKVCDSFLFALFIKCLMPFWYLGKIAPITGAGKSSCCCSHGTIIEIVGDRSCAFLQNDWKWVPLLFLRCHFS